MATILIVDDDHHIRRFLACILADLGHEVVGEARDGVSAIAQARELHPQVVLLDVVMPGADGISILPELHAAAPAAQVVLTTSIDPLRCGVLARADGLAGFLTKPVDLHDLRRVLGRIATQGSAALVVR